MAHCDGSSSGCVREGGIRRVAPPPDTEPQKEKAAVAMMDRERFGAAPAGQRQSERQWGLDASAPVEDPSAPSQTGAEATAWAAEPRLRRPAGPICLLRCLPEPDVKLPKSHFKGGVGYGWRRGPVCRVLVMASSTVPQQSMAGSPPFPSNHCVCSGIECLCSRCK